MALFSSSLLRSRTERTITMIAVRTITHTTPTSMMKHYNPEPLRSGQSPRKSGHLVVSGSLPLRPGEPPQSPGARIERGALWPPNRFFLGRPRPRGTSDSSDLIARSTSSNSWRSLARISAMSMARPFLLCAAALKPRTLTAKLRAAANQPCWWTSYNYIRPLRNVP